MFGTDKNSTVEGDERSETILVRVAWVGAADENNVGGRFEV